MKFFNKWFLKRKVILLLTVFLILSWLLLNFKITDVPPGINGDEAHIAYNAMLIAQSGHDQNNKLLPIFISNSEQKDWKQPITVYFAVLGFKLIGLSYVVFKQVSVFFALIGGLMIFLLIKEIFSTRLAFIGFILYITTPIVFIQSHLTLENIAPVPFVAFWLYMLIKYQENKYVYFLFWAGLGLGVSFYSYLGMRLIVPVLVMLSLFSIYFINRKAQIRFILKPVLVFAISLIPLLIMSLIIKGQYPGAILAENRPQLLNSYQEFLLPYLSSYDFSFLFIKGDSTPYHSTGKHGIFLLATLPLFILGCYSAVKKKSFITFALLTFLLIPVLFGFTGSVFRGSRLLAFVPAYILVIVSGLNLILTIQRPAFKKFIIGCILISIVFNFYDFIRDYWYFYPTRVKSYFSSDAHLTFKTLSEYSVKLNRAPVILWDLYNKEGTTAKFFEQIYFPNTLMVKNINEEIPPQSLFLISSDKLTAMEKEGFTKLDIQIAGYAFIFN